MKIGMKTEINKGPVSSQSLSVLATVSKVFESKYHILFILYFPRLNVY